MDWQFPLEPIRTKEAFKLLMEEDREGKAKPELQQKTPSSSTKVLWELKKGIL